MYFMMSSIGRSHVFYDVILNRLYWGSSITVRALAYCAEDHGSSGLRHISIHPSANRDLVGALGR